MQPDEEDFISVYVLRWFAAYDTLALPYVLFGAHIHVDDLSIMSSALNGSGIAEAEGCPFPIAN